MRTAKVKVIRIQGHNKTTYKSGETVTENDLPDDNFDTLIKGGYIEETKPDETKQGKTSKKNLKLEEENE